MVRSRRPSFQLYGTRKSVRFENGSKDCVFGTRSKHSAVSCLIRSALLVVSFSAASVNCSANLGDTLDQSIKRFGQPISHGKGDSTDAGYPWYAFKYGGCEIEELFDGSGIVRIETYWKKDRSAITEKEQKEILQTESSNAKWGKPKISDASTIWLRDDGANAMYSHDFHELSLCGGIRKH